MAILKYEGFDHETAAADLYAGILSTLIVTGPTQSASIVLSGLTQYSVGQSLAVTATNSTNADANAIAIMPFTPAANSVIVGAALSLSASVGNGVVMGFVNANAGQVYCYISAGALKVFRGDPTGISVQLGSTVNSAVASLGWAFVEMKAVIAPGTAGSVIVQINGTTVYTQTGLNTSNDGTTTVTGLMLGTSSVSQTAGGFTSYFDDVYIADTSGSAPYNGFLGPVRVVTQFPIANGAITNFTGLAHHPNWQNVSESGMDADATYNFSAQTGSIDSFTGGALPGSASGVYAVKVTAAGRIDDAGIRTVQTYLKSGNSTTLGANVNLVGSFQYFSDMYTLDPANGGSWSPSAVNLVQFGYKIVPSPGSPVALGAGTINITFIGTAVQSSTMTAVATMAFSVRILMILPIQISAVKTIGTITALATVQQGVNLTSTTTLFAISAQGALSPGLQASAAIRVGIFASIASLQQVCSMSASASLVPVWGAVINQGLAATASIVIRPTIQGAIAQNSSMAGTATLLPKAVVSAVQSSLLTGSARLGAVAASGTLSGASAANIHIGLSNWVASRAYVAKARVAATFNGVTNAYEANISGTSGTTQPNGTGASFTDGTLTWKYLSHVDYSDLNVWAAAIPATLTQPIIGLLWNNGTITTTAGTPFVTIGSDDVQHVTSSVNTITLKPAPGEGIRDSLLAGSTALAFNTTKGVSFTLPTGVGGVNYINVWDSNVIITGLQFKDPYSASGSTIVQQLNTSTKLTISNCIFDGYSQTGGACIVGCGTGRCIITNSLIVDRTAANPDYGAAIITNSANNAVVNCTIVAIAAPGAGTAGVVANSAPTPVRNTIIMGYPNCIGGGGGPISPADHCLFDQADLGYGGVDAGNNLYSRLAINQFTSPTTDFRLKTGAEALNGGVTDLINIPTADDIAGTHRPQGVSWDIGAHEK